ncbi:diacylglycerol/lipid kinase family protein [Nocardioides yefusunii]|uniref:Diacylglycerol/lipid kinase family protein n=1 Tax=Nocardioides yefusunii TaxID=2500546 RepID=A0ABW1QSK4_9ACTN|nr:diacylglycerol kinase family protein [Nocardioides yefusunii]
MPVPAVVILANPFAGRGVTADALGPVRRRLLDAGHRVRAVVNDDAALALQEVRTAVNLGATAVIAVGGDGTVHLALQAVAGTGVPLGIVATGHGNDTARALDLPLHDVEAAMDVILSGRVTHLDAGRADDRWFLTVLAAGFDAVVNERANRMRWPRGPWRYNLATLIEASSFRPLRYSLELDGVRSEHEGMLVAIANCPTFGGGLRIADGALTDDGFLDVVTVGQLNKLELARTYPRLFTGSLTSHPQYQVHRARRVTVHAPDVVAYADGERIGPLPLTVECIPSAVKVFA